MASFEDNNLVQTAVGVMKTQDRRLLGALVIFYACRPSNLQTNLNCLATTFAVCLYFVY